MWVDIAIGGNVDLKSHYFLWLWTFSLLFFGVGGGDGGMATQNRVNFLMEMNPKYIYYISKKRNTFFASFKNYE